MNWHKITFNDDQIMHSEAATLLPKVQTIFRAAFAPEDFCVFKEETYDDKGNGNVIYFSPVASSFCAQLLLAYGGKKCDMPTLSEDLSGWVGDRACSRLLMTA